MIFSTSVDDIASQISSVDVVSVESVAYNLRVCMHLHVDWRIWHYRTMDRKKVELATTTTYGLSSDKWLSNDK